MAAVKEDNQIEEVKNGVNGLHSMLSWFIWLTS